MNYPLISEYIDAIRSAEDNFDKLSNFRPVLDDNGNPSDNVEGLLYRDKLEDVTRCLYNILGKTGED